MNQRQIVLTGYVGSGKTSLFNLICQTKQPTSQYHSTQQAFLKKAAYGSGFRVLDTPGYASKTNKIIHAVGVLNALSEGPVDQILLIVKWDRIEFMQDYIQNMVLKFIRFKHLLTVAVTHWDTVDRQTINEDKEKIGNLCKSFGINSVIFLSKFDSGENVCAQIDSILNRSKAEDVQFTEAEFYSNFDLIELKPEVEFELEVEKADVINKFRYRARHIKQFINQFDENHPQMHEIMHNLTLETKKIARNLILDSELRIYNQFSKLFDYHLAYSVHFEIKKAVMEEIEQIVKFTQQKMKNNKRNFFNFIKACPHCILVQKPAKSQEIIDTGNIDYFAQEVQQEELKKILMKSQMSLHIQVEQTKQKYKVINL